MQFKDAAIRVKLRSAQECKTSRPQVLDVMRGGTDGSLTCKKPGLGRLCGNEGFRLCRGPFCFGIRRSWRGGGWHR
jgi:hypothetical protein